MKCLACGGTHMSPWATAKDVEYLSTDDTFDYLLCGSCQALSINPVPRNRLSEIYPETYYSFSPNELSFVERVKQALDRRTFSKLFSPIVGEELAALDVGGGAGWLLTQAKAVEPRLNHTQVVDIDASAQAELISVWEESADERGLNMTVMNHLCKLLMKLCQTAEE